MSMTIILLTSEGKDILQRFGEAKVDLKKAKFENSHWHNFLYDFSHGENPLRSLLGDFTLRKIQPYDMQALTCDAGPLGILDPTVVEPALPMGLPEYWVEKVTMRTTIVDNFRKDGRYRCQNGTIVAMQDYVYSPNSIDLVQRLSVQANTVAAAKDILRAFLAGELFPEAGEDFTAPQQERPNN